jgi:uncharacterized membrane protein
VSWRSEIVAGILLLVGVALAVLATEVSQDLTMRRSASCDGTLPMPVSGFWDGWLSAALTLAALILAVAKIIRRGRARLSIVIVWLATLAFAFAIFVLYTLFGDAEPIRSLCSG